MKSAVALVAAAVAVALVSPAAAVRPAPVLKLVHGSPLVLSGAHFASRERVTVTVHTPSSYLRRVVTRADGSFTASFGTVKAARCGGLNADALGATGDRASLRIPRGACTSPPGTP